MHVQQRVVLAHAIVFKRGFTQPLVKFSLYSDFPAFAQLVLWEPSGSHNKLGGAQMSTQRLTYIIWWWNLHHPDPGAPSHSHRRRRYIMQKIPQCCLSAGDVHSWTSVNLIRRDRHEFISEFKKYIYILGVGVSAWRDLTAEMWWDIKRHEELWCGMKCTSSLPCITKVDPLTKYLYNNSWKWMFERFYE